MPDQLLAASTQSCEDSTGEVPAPVDNAPAAPFPLRRLRTECVEIGIVAQHGWALPSGFKHSSRSRSDRIAPRTRAGPRLEARVPGQTRTPDGRACRRTPNS